MPVAFAAAVAIARASATTLGRVEGAMATRWKTPGPGWPTTRFAYGRFGACADGEVQMFRQR